MTELFTYRIKVVRRKKRRRKKSKKKSGKNYPFLAKREHHKIIGRRTRAERSGGKRFSRSFPQFPLPRILAILVAVELEAEQRVVAAGHLIGLGGRGVKGPVLRGRPVQNTLSFETTTSDIDNP